ncbi:MAG: ASCH domain-containing protein [Candidatus Helarchaeota archaeon]|nr:ASCH domain-containing protein [Candidatus Helarchaeota archaeon]
MHQLESDKELPEFDIDRIFCEAAMNQSHWKLIKRKMEKKGTNFLIHLAIFVEPYLKYILEGKKTVESRFSVNRIAPYKKVHRGDIVLLKRSGGPIVGLCMITDVWFYRLDPKTWLNIKKEFSQYLCVQDPSFWSARENASYATLMKLGHIIRIEPTIYKKRDRRGWVVLNSREKTSKLRIDDF